MLRDKQIHEGLVDLVTRVKGASCPMDTNTSQTASARGQHGAGRRWAERPKGMLRARHAPGAAGADGSTPKPRAGLVVWRGHETLGSFQGREQSGFPS